MQVKATVGIERIIAKIDNDFNPDNSDWIPRVGAWCIDAMSQLDVLRTKTKKIKVAVKDKIAYTECAVLDDTIKVYDSNGCKVEKAKKGTGCNGCSSTGSQTSQTGQTSDTSQTSDINGVETTSIIITNNEEDDAGSFAETINGHSPYRYNIYNMAKLNPNNRNYVLVDCNKLELNFDADYIYIVVNHIETICSETFGCELPVIPNNGLLIEALTYYCMYKMLCRGYKHPVFNLNASQYGTNPYYEWNLLKDKAKVSVIGDSIDIGNSSKMFRSNLYIETFDPRA